MNALIVTAVAFISIMIGVEALDGYHQSERDAEYSEWQDDRDALAERTAQPGWCETGCAP